MLKILYISYRASIIRIDLGGMLVTEMFGYSIAVLATTTCDQTRCAFPETVKYFCSTRLFLSSCCAALHTEFLRRRGEANLAY